MENASGVIDRSILLVRRVNMNIWSRKRRKSSSIKILGGWISLRSFKLGMKLTRTTIQISRSPRNLLLSLNSIKTWNQEPLPQVLENSETKSSSVSSSSSTSASRSSMTKKCGKLKSACEIKCMDMPEHVSTPFRGNSSKNLKIYSYSLTN